LVKREAHQGGEELLGFVLAGGRRHPLFKSLEPRPSGIELEAVLLEDLDGDGIIEPIIMSSFLTGAGPQGAIPRFENYILDWDAGRNIYLPLQALGRKIEALESVEAIRTRLKAEEALIFETARPSRRVIADPPGCSQ